MTRFAAIGLFIAVALAAPAAAQQNSDIADLRRQAEGLDSQLRSTRKELGRLQAQATGDDDSVTPNVAAQFEIRLGQLERALQNLTGKVEQVEYEVRELKRRQEAFERDIEFRVKELEGGKTGSTKRSQARNTNPERRATQDERADNVGRSESRREARRSIETVGDPGGQYESAVKLLRQRDYVGAETAFQSFIEDYPQNDRTASAHYWLGEIYYSQQRYQEAAVQYADGYRNFQNHSRAPENLLKLGMSLARLDQKANACQTFAELRRRFPGAGSHIRRTLEEERQRLGCS